MDEYDCYAVQVAAAVVMGTGRPMREEFRRIALQAGLEDPWGEEDDERTAVIRSYLEAVRGYDGTAPVVLGNKTLMERFAEVVEERVVGLVNKGPGTF